MIIQEIYDEKRRTAAEEYAENLARLNASRPLLEHAASVVERFEAETGLEAELSIGSLGYCDVRIVVQLQDSTALSYYANLLVLFSESELFDGELRYHRQQGLLQIRESGSSNLLLLASQELFIELKIGEDLCVKRLVKMFETPVYEYDC